MYCNVKKRTKIKISLTWIHLFCKTLEKWLKIRAVEGAAKNKNTKKEITENEENGTN